MVGPETNPAIAASTNAATIPPMKQLKEDPEPDKKHKKEP